MNSSLDRHPPVAGPVDEPVAETHLESYGVRFAVRANRPEMLQALTDYLPPVRCAARLQPKDRTYSLISSMSGGSSDDFHRLYVGSRLRLTSCDPLDLFDQLEGELQLHVGEMTRRFVFLHAGVVAWNGFGILLPGRSFCGKSTLVTALVRAGATYYSDEFAVLDENGDLYPYPRRLSLRERGYPRAVRRTVESLGGRCGTAAIRPRLVLLTRYNPQKPSLPRPVVPSEAMLELVRNSLSIRRQAATVLEVLGKLVNEAVVLRSERGDANEAAACLLQSNLLA